MMVLMMMDDYLSRTGIPIDCEMQAHASLASEGTSHFVWLFCKQWREGAYRGRSTLKRPPSSSGWQAKSAVALACGILLVDG
jgi:hypothetical protein